MVPEAPDTIDLRGSGGPWTAFVISGLVGGLAGYNGTYTYDGSFVNDRPVWRKVDDADVTVQQEYDETRYWMIIDNGVGQTNQTTDGDPWPWSEGAVWGAASPIFTRALAAPGTIELPGAAAIVAATLTTALVGANNDLLFTSTLPGRLGNDQRIRYLDPGANNAALSITISGRDTTVNLATGAGGAIITTAAQIAGAIEEFLPTEVPLAVELAPGSDATGVVTAMAWTNLSGGAGGLPPAPDTIAL